MFSDPSNMRRIQVGYHTLLPTADSDAALNFYDGLRHNIQTSLIWGELWFGFGFFLKVVCDQKMMLSICKTKYLRGTCHGQRELQTVIVMGLIAILK